MVRVRLKLILGAVCVAACMVTVAAQTPVVAPKNKYSPSDDVKLGQDAAKQVEKEMPVMRDSEVNGYLTSIGRRLAENIPPEFRHPEFHYSFTGVNLKEINAFALPGGPMFINRGMIEKAHTEGEVAGVMAHELSHVALRHGTAQQTKATPYAVGEVAGQILGAIVGGTRGQILSQASQFGIGTYFMKFSREYEKQADILGSHIMASAGYDPRDMANVFRTIEQETGSGGPQWLSDHPNPGDRYAYLNQEAELLHVGRVAQNTQQFQQVQAHLRTLPPALTAEEVARNSKSGRPPAGSPDAPPRKGNIPPPDSRMASYNEGNLFHVSVPTNWRELSNNNSVTFAPTGASGTVNGASVFTHGVELGVSRNESHDLHTATTELLQSLRAGNPQLRAPQGYDDSTIGGRQALHTIASNVSDATGTQEVIEVYTTMLGNGSLFYVFGVAPRAEYDGYAGVFRAVVRSVQFVQ